MDASFWRERWAQGQTGFHQDGPHPDLVSQRTGLLADGPQRILVPLCGKSQDMLWLVAAGHDVYGVELVPEAVFSFLHENGLNAEVRSVERSVEFQMAGLTLRCGDFLSLSRTEIGLFDLVWDRAALVALDAERREQFASVVQDVLRPDGVVMLNAFDYDQSEMDGPPHAVPLAEIQRLYPNWQVDELRRGSDQTEGKFAERGVSVWRDSLYALRRPPVS